MKKRIVSFWWLIAVLSPVGTILVPFFIKNSARSLPLSLGEESGPLLIGSLIVAAPFIILALWTKEKLKNGHPENRNAVITSGFTVLSLFFILVSWILWDVFTRTSGGANIGGGILLMASPIVFPVIMIVTYQILKKK